MNTDQNPLNQPSIKLFITVQKWAFNVISGQSSSPPSHYPGHDLGLIKLAGLSHGETPQGLEFWVHFFPDGTNLPPASYAPAANRVTLCMNWCQVASITELLRKAKAAHALYRVDNGVVYADVHGEF